MSTPFYILYFTIPSDLILAKVLSGLDYRHNIIYINYAKINCQYLTTTLLCVSN